MIIYIVIITLAIIYYAWYAYVFLYLAPKKQKALGSRQSNTPQEINSSDSTPSKPLPEKKEEVKSKNIQKMNIFAQVSVPPSRNNPPPPEEAVIQEGEDNRTFTQEDLPAITKEEMDVSEDPIEKSAFHPEVESEIEFDEEEESPEIDFGFQPYKEDEPPKQKKKGFDKADNDLDIDQFFNR